MVISIRVLVEVNGLNMSLPIITIQDIRGWEPCYDPGKHLPEDWKGTALDILKMSKVPAEDRLWVVLRDGIIDDKRLRLFAVWCAREALKLVQNPDPRSVAACDVTERYALGEATTEELKAASKAAWAAEDAVAVALAAATSAATAAWDAAASAAWDAAWETQVKKLIEMLESTC